MSDMEVQPNAHPALPAVLAPVVPDTAAAVGATDTPSAGHSLHDSVHPAGGGGWGWRRAHGLAKTGGGLLALHPSDDFKPKPPPTTPPPPPAPPAAEDNGPWRIKGGSGKVWYE